jgi:hypothetical protein
MPRPVRQITGDRSHGPVRASPRRRDRERAGTAPVKRLRRGIVRAARTQRDRFDLRRHHRDHEGDHRPQPRSVGLTRRSTKSVLPTPSTMLDRKLEPAACGRSVSGNGGPCRPPCRWPVSAHGQGIQQDPKRPPMAVPLRAFAGPAPNSRSLTRLSSRRPRPSRAATADHKSGQLAFHSRGPDVPHRGRSGRSPRGRHCITIRSACSRWVITKGGQAANYANVPVDNRAPTRRSARPSGVGGTRERAERQELRAATSSARFSAAPNRSRPGATVHATLTAPREFVRFCAPHRVDRHGGGRAAA